MTINGNRQHVVITGMGIICGLGKGKAAVLDGIRNNRSAIRKIASFDPTPFAREYGCEIADYRPIDHFPTELLQYYNRCTQFALLALEEAVDEAKLNIPEVAARDRVGICVGSSHGALDVIVDYYHHILSGQPEAIDRDFLFRKLHSSILKVIAKKYGVTGPFSMISTACASGPNALGLAADWLQSGRADYVLVGASDVFDIALHAGFCGLGAVAEGPVAPFSGTPGITLGEGAAFFVLELEATANKRSGAKVLGELLGYGLSGDAYHATAPDPQGRGVVLAMQRAVDEAGISPDTIDYVNAHGTGTSANDEMESRAYKAFFGERASQVPISSTKSFFGHATGAAGALETCVSLLGMNHDVLPPTLNFSEPRSDHGLDFIPNQARSQHIDTFMSNSFGFAGNNASLLIGRHSVHSKVARPRLERRQVVVTGIGIVSPLGVGASAFSEGLRRQTRAAKAITRFDTSEYNGRHAILFDEFKARQYDRQIDDRRMDLISRMTAVAAGMCLDDAGVGRKRKDTKNIGIIMCVASAPRQGIDEHLKKLIREGQPSSAHFPYSTQNSALGQVSLHLGLQGFTTNLHIDGCSGLGGLVYAHDAIGLGHADQVLVGGGDEVFWSYFQELSVLGELAGDDRPRVPFDSRHSGFHPGEGAIFFMLEALDSAHARDARIYAELVATSMQIDANDDLTANDAAGTSLASATRNVLQAAGIERSQIGLVSTTERGIGPIRSAEANALNHTLASELRNVAMINCIPMTGWMDSVSPLFNLAATFEAFKTGEVHPHFESDEIDPIVAPMLKRKQVAPGRDHALCLGVAREGYNYALLFRAQPTCANKE